MRPETIAIDGPAGSGKSTIGQALAARLNYAMVDTGLIYRLVARGVLDDGIDPDDRPAVFPRHRLEVRDAAIRLALLTVASS